MSAQAKAMRSQAPTILYIDSVLDESQNGWMAPSLISPDGRWWWDGAQWRSRTVEGDLDLFWFTTTPEWFTRVLVTGLINLIPIVGAINLYGWTLAATDMVRQKWRELPPAGFQYLERGVAPFVVGLVYGLVGFIVLGALVASAVVVGASDRSHLPIAFAIGALAVVLAIGWWLLMLYLYAAILVGADRLGIARALDPGTLWRISRANGRLVWKVSVIYFVASLAVVALSSAVAFIVPFGGLLASLALPAVFAMIVPSLAMIVIEPTQDLAVQSER